MQGGRKSQESCGKECEISAPKVRAPVLKKRKVDEASSLEPTFQNSASKEHNVDEDTSFESVSLSQRKKRKTAAKNDDIIDPNQCCVCFRTFEEDEMQKTGMEWVECACKRWLHEDCIDHDVINVDVDGKELLCPYCCV